MFDPNSKEIQQQLDALAAKDFGEFVRSEADDMMVELRSRGVIDPALLTIISARHEDYGPDSHMVTFSGVFVATFLDQEEEEMLLLHALEAALRRRNMTVQEYLESVEHTLQRVSTETPPAEAGEAIP